MFFEHLMQKISEVKKHLEDMTQNDIIIQEWLFKEEFKPNKNKIKKVYNSKILKQIARKIIN